MDANKFCMLHTEYLIDREVTYETQPHRNIYAEKLGDIDAVDMGSKAPKPGKYAYTCLVCGKTGIGPRKGQKFCGYACMCLHTYGAQYDGKWYEKKHELILVLYKKGKSLSEIARVVRYKDDSRRLVANLCSDDTAGCGADAWCCGGSHRGYQCADRA